MPSGRNTSSSQEALVGHPAHLLDEVSGDGVAGLRVREARAGRPAGHARARVHRQHLAQGAVARRAPSKISLKRISSKPEVCSSRCATCSGWVRSQGFFTAELGGQRPHPVLEPQPALLDQPHHRQGDEALGDRAHPEQRDWPSIAASARRAPEALGQHRPAGATSATAAPGAPVARWPRRSTAQRLQITGDRTGARIGRRYGVAVRKIRQIQRAEGARCYVGRTWRDRPGCSGPGGQTGHHQEPPQGPHPPRHDGPPKQAMLTRPPTGGQPRERFPAKSLG